MVDRHPLIREHYSEVLKAEDPEGWTKCHEMLYEYYKKFPEKLLPDTLEEMEPLFLAVRHGCEAHLHTDVLVDVYQERIRRGEEPSIIVLINLVVLHMN